MQRGGGRLLAFWASFRSIKGCKNRYRSASWCYEDRVRAVLGGRPIGEFPLAGVAHTMALFVNRATASFRALVVHRPCVAQKSRPASLYHDDPAAHPLGTTSTSR